MIDIVFNKKRALKMITDGKTSAVLKYIDKYIELDFAVAEKIIKKGTYSDVENLLAKLESFEVEDIELLALSLIENGYGKFVVNNLNPIGNKWSRLISNTLLDGLNISLLDDFLLQIDSFDIDPSDAAIKIIAKHKNAGAYRVLKELSSQHKLNDKVAYEIIKQGKLIPTVNAFLNELNNFNLSHNLALHKILDCHNKEGARIIADNIISIENIDIKIAYRLIEYGEIGNTLLSLDHFLGSKDSELLLHILLNSTSKDQLEFLDINEFGLLSTDVASKLITLDKIDDVYLHLDKFKNLSMQVAEILAKNSKLSIYADDLTESLESFSDEARAYLNNTFQTKKNIFDDEEQNTYEDSTSESNAENTSWVNNVKGSFYEILGIEANATRSEIKRAYRKLITKHHPDKGGDEIIAKKINEAYTTLSNPEKRRLYDLQYAYASNESETQEEEYNSAKDEPSTDNGNTTHNTHEQAEQRSWNPDVIAGFFWLGLGLLITFGTYAAASDAGGHYVISFGPIIYGLYRLFKI